MAAKPNDPFRYDHYEELKIILSHLSDNISEIKSDVKELKIKLAVHDNKFTKYETTISILIKFAMPLMSLGYILFTIKKHFLT